MDFESIAFCRLGYGGRSSGLANSTMSPVPASRSIDGQPDAVPAVRRRVRRTVRGRSQDACVHPRKAVTEALQLAATGLRPVDIAQRLDIPAGTVRHWCRGDRRAPRTDGRDVGCPRCDGAPLDEWQYSYLLGAYLGDGYINVGRRGVASLSVACAECWPGVAAEVRAALRAVMPGSAVCDVARIGCWEIKSYAVHWPCLFPQHGVGRKHTRPIVLEPWQQHIVEQLPGRLLRGLFHSDGCRVTNGTRKRTSGGTKRYDYPRYFFSNKSTDILDICAAALDRLDIPHRRPRWDMISVARRQAIARLDEFVGPKY